MSLEIKERIKRQINYKKYLINTGDSHEQE